MKGKEECVITESHYILKECFPKGSRGIFIGTQKFATIFKLCSQVNEWLDGYPLTEYNHLILVYAFCL